MKNLQVKILALFIGLTSLVSCSKDDDSAETTSGLIPSALNFEEVTVTGNHFSARRWHRTTVFNNKIWLIGGELGDGSSHDNGVWSSTDGVNWTQVLTPGHVQFSSVAGGSLLTFDNKMWLIGGFMEGAISRNDIWNSTDGVTWNQVTTTNVFTDRHFFGATVHNNKMWIVGGTNGGATVGSNDVWSSADGITWTQHTITGNSFSNRLHHKLVSYNNKLYVIGGYSDGTYLSDVWSTTDGNTWTKETDGGTSFPGKLSFEVVVKNNLMYVISGQQTGGSLTDEVFKSDNGKKWVKDNVITSYGARRDFQAVMFNNKLTIIGGWQGSYSNDVWTLN